MIDLRPAVAADLAAINEIYNHYVTRSTCTYQELPETLAERAAWFAAHGPTHPVLVAVDGKEVVGWGSLSPFQRRSGYRFTVEDSVYVRENRHGRGIGSSLLAELIARAKKLHHRSIIAGIDAEQPASLKLHEKFGFTRVAHLKQVGFKFERWLDVMYLQLVL
jgi:L-amino acid N-acyltransferase